MANAIYQNPRRQEFSREVLHEGDIDTLEVIADIVDGPGTLEAIHMDTAADDILSIWNNVNPTVGNDAPDHQIPTGDGQWLVFPQGMYLSKGLSYAVSNVGGTVISGNPTGVNTIQILIKADN